jgi:hypothetical protein
LKSLIRLKSKEAIGDAVSRLAFSFVLLPYASSSPEG